MAGDLDIVGTAAVDVVPIAPNFHTKLQAIVLPAADRVGEDAGRRMGDEISRNIVISIPDAITRGGQAARVAATRQGDNTGGAFATSLRRKLEVAFKAMPKLDIRLSDTGVDAELARLRARMETLSNKRIGVDVDVAAAEAEVRAIDEELRRLGERHPNIAVRADTAAARAALEEFRAEIASVDERKSVKIDVDTSGAEGALFRLSVALGAVAAIPLAPIAAAGIGAIASAAVAAGAGVGALALAAVPAIKGVTDAITAKTAADKASATATSNSASADKQAAQSALQMASAQQALTSAHRNAARSIAQANRQVEDAERAVAQAAQSAADQRRQAAQNVERAERSLADAQKQAQQAEADLTQARKDAAQQLDDLNNKLADGALSQRDAALRVQEAAAELGQVKQSYDAGTASDIDLSRAQLSYDQAVQAQKEQSQSYKQLQTDATAARKAGVDGNDAVKKAADALAQAQQNVTDQTTALAQAHQDAARTEVQAAQSVADAQRNLADAVQNVADTQVQAADSIASAERGVESARLSSINTTSTATTKTAAYQAAIAKLTPEQRKLYDSIAGPRGLTPAFKAWSASLQPTVLPLFIRAIDAAKNSLPALTPLVKAAADAIGDLFDRASKALKSPFWQGFKDDIDKSAKPAIVGLGIAFGNIFTGMAGIVDAFLPHMDGISLTMQRITGRFANWGKSLKGSPEFERFLQYVKDTSPGVAEFLRKLLTAALDVAQAIAPLSGTLFAVVGPVLDALSWLATNAPEVVQVLWGLYAVNKAISVGMAAFGVAMGIYNTAVALASLETWSWAAAIQATGVVPLIELIVVAVVALGLAVYEAYQHVGWFRTAVDASWAGIKIATLFLWDKVIKPVFGLLWDGLKLIGSTLMWLWKNVFEPAWSAIATIMKVAFAIIATVVIAPFVIAFNLLGKLLGWLWTDGFKPTWDLIVTLLTVVWKKYVQPFFQGFWSAIKWVGGKFADFYHAVIAPVLGWIASAMGAAWKKWLHPFFVVLWDAIKWVGDKFKWLYDHSVAPVVGWIADGAKWLYNKGIKPAFDNIKKAIGLVGEAFGFAKDAIKKAWDKVASIAAKPVNFIVDMVYTHGIKAVWDKVAGFVGLGKLPKAPKLLDDTPKFAEGGRTSGGVPGVDSIPILAMADEFIIKRSSARKIGFGNLAYMNATGELPRFAGGGIVGALGSAWDWTKDAVGSAVSKGIDWASKAADLIAHPSKVWNQLMKPILSSVQDHLGVADIGKMLAKIPVKAVNGLKNMIVNAVTGGGGGAADVSGLGDLGAHGASAKQAQNIARAMLPAFGWGADQMAPLIKLWNGESGWRWNALNSSSGAYGIPQALPAGKMASAGPDWRTNAATQIKWGLGYIKGRSDYGSPAAAWSKWLSRSPHWYDSGGYLPTGLSLVANGTGSPEPVFTGSQWSDIRAAKSGGGSTQLHADVRVFVGDREITDIVDTRINMREASTASDINNGRWV